MCKKNMDEKIRHRLESEKLLDIHRRNYQINKEQLDTILYLGVINTNQREFSIGKLAELAGIKPSTFSEYINDLIKKGFVKKYFFNSDDLRKRRIKLTHSGLDCYQKAMGLMQ